MNGAAMLGCDDVLNAACHPCRFAEIAEKHRKAFAWQPQDYIPLGIHVVDPRHFSSVTYSDWLNPLPFFETQKQVLVDTLSVGSDLLPAVGLNHLGDAVVTSMFGARQFLPEEWGTTLQDVGPTPIPVYSSLEEAAEAPMPRMDAGIMPEVERIARFYRANLPAWVHVVAPMPSGPFSSALELRGSDLLLELIDRPELCQAFIEKCARVQVRVEQRIRRLAGTPRDEHVTNFGILGTGLRLGEDSMVNLSPTLIRRHCLPVFGLVNDLCGGRGHVHFCSLENSRFEHIYPALANTAEVAVVSSQFGFEFYENRLDELRGRLAVESFYGGAYAYVCRTFGSFRDWARDFVRRFRNESGLVLYFQVTSVEEGKRVWAAWQEAHR